MMRGIQALLDEAVKAKSDIEEAEKNRKNAEYSLTETENTKKG